MEHRSLELLPSPVNHPIDPKLGFLCFGNRVWSQTCKLMLLPSECRDYCYTQPHTAYSSFVYFRERVWLYGLT